MTLINHSYNDNAMPCLASIFDAISDVKQTATQTIISWEVIFPETVHQWLSILTPVS